MLNVRENVGKDTMSQAMTALVVKSFENGLRSPQPNSSQYHEHKVEGELVSFAVRQQEIFNSFEKIQK